MNTRQGALRRSWLLALVVCVPLVSCGGGKRPPAVATSGPSRPQDLRSDSAQLVESGPDIRQVDTDVARGEDFALSDPQSGEGGPLADIYFEFDQAALTGEARGVLGKHASWLGTHPGAKVTVEGHCDERGTVEYNLALGDKRAQATREYLVQLGVVATRLKGVSFGKERPLDPASTEAAWARNRRAHFVVSR